MNEAMIQQGLFYVLRSSSLVVMPNYTPGRWFESDIYQVTTALYPIEFEVKISVPDFKADFAGKSKKHRALAGEDVIAFDGSALNMPVEMFRRPRRFWYVMPPDIADQVIIPEYAGLMIALPWGSAADIRRVKEAPNLGAEKVTQEAVARMHRNFYRRYWSLRGDRLEAADMLTGRGGVAMGMGE